MQLSRFVQCPDASSKASGADDVLAPRACTERSQCTRGERVRASNHKASKNSRAKAVNCPLGHSHSGAHAACALKARRGARKRARAQECKQVHAKERAGTRRRAGVRTRVGARAGRLASRLLGRPLSSRCLTALPPQPPEVMGRPPPPRQLREMHRSLSQSGSLWSASARVRACARARAGSALVLYVLPLKPIRYKA